MSLEGKFKIEDKIFELQENVEQLHPAVFDKDEPFKFTIPEFLDRCLRSMYAIY